MVTRISGVYAIFHLPTGRAYVGSAVDIVRRMKEHRRALKGGKHKCGALARLWARDGAEAFSFRIVAEAHPGYLVAAEQLAMNRFEASGQLLNKVAASRQGSTRDKQQVVAARFGLYYQAALNSGWLARLKDWPIFGHFARKIARARAAQQARQFAMRIKA